MFSHNHTPDLDHAPDRISRSITIRSRIMILRRLEKDPAALFAADNLFPGFDRLDRGGGQFHVATGTDPVFYGDDGGIALTLEQPLKSAEHALVDFARALRSLLRHLL